MSYKLKKKIWTEADFDNMGWHDNHIYKIRLTEDLEFDIDYIFQWNKPDLEGLPFTFWIAPATLVFKDIKSLSFELNGGLHEGFEIEDIERKNENQWTILTRQGDVSFTSDGYEQFIRQEPSFQFRQIISYIERGGYSLARVTDQGNPVRAREDLQEQRQQALELYEDAKNRHIKRQELEALIRSGEAKEIETKSYLLKKEQINEAIASYDLALAGTQFENW